MCVPPHFSAFGRTKIRHVGTGKAGQRDFGSSLVGLMNGFGDTDLYSAGLDMAPDAPIRPRCILVDRHYDQFSASFSNKRDATIYGFAQSVGDLIRKLRDISSNPTQVKKMDGRLHSRQRIVRCGSVGGNRIVDRISQSLIKQCRVGYRLTAAFTNSRAGWLCCFGRASATGAPEPP
jgi:hypothetical protein